MNLDSENSDIDVSIIAQENEITLLNTIADAIESCKSPYFQISRVLQARIPLISIVDTLADNLQLDLSIWKLDKLEIAKVFEAYLSIDERVTPLIYAVRVWSKARKINNAYTGWINSFGWTVMVVAFLQINSVVPQIEELDLTKEKQDWQITNSSPVGVLFVQFFEWLLAFDYEKQRISIRHGGVTAKEADKFTDDVVFCVERPRTPYQNITRQVCHRTLKVIRKEWKRVLRLIEQGAKFQDLCAASDTHKLN
uniref:Polynucleotide adenylyltransferase n=1 Tax=Arcella intermedia TaxID=1963864 RepID=A0A6B2LCG1_9EUKA